jgi:hypothetical protein
MALREPDAAKEWTVSGRATVNCLEMPLAESGIVVHDVHAIRHKNGFTLGDIGIVVM